MINTDSPSKTSDDEDGVPSPKPEDKTTSSVGAPSASADSAQSDGIDTVDDIDLEIPFINEELMAGLTDAEKTELQDKIKKINRWVGGKPETAVRTVRNWLEQEDKETEDATDED